MGSKDIHGLLHDVRLAGIYPELDQLPEGVVTRPGWVVRLYTGCAIFLEKKFRFGFSHRKIPFFMWNQRDCYLMFLPRGVVFLKRLIGSLYLTSAAASS